MEEYIMYNKLLIPCDLCKSMLRSHTVTQSLASREARAGPNTLIRDIKQ